MKMLNMRPMHIGVAAILFSMMAQASETPEIKIEIDKITVEDSVYTPYYEVKTEQDHQQGASDRWIMLGVYFTTDGGWIDELDITQMASKPIKGADERVVLSETVHYINLEPGDHKVSVYLHPSYVKRYDVKAFDLDSAAVIRMGGKEVARKETTRHGEKGWSSDTGAAQNKGYLLNHAETPFWFINYDFKEIIKKVLRRFLW